MNYTIKAISTRNISALFEDESGKQEWYKILPELLPKLKKSMLITEVKLKNKHIVEYTQITQEQPAYHTAKHTDVEGKCFYMLMEVAALSLPRGATEQQLYDRACKLFKEIEGKDW